MIIGIIGAMDEEVEKLLLEIELEVKTVKAQMEFNKGKLWGKTVVLVRSGIGKVNAAICAQILIDDYSVSNIINVGIAGGTHVDMLPGDVVVGGSLIQHDMDTIAFGYKAGQIPRLDTFDFVCDESLVKVAVEACKNLKEHKSYVGRIVTGDQFINKAEKLQWLCAEFEALACEMEGGSIAQVCYLNQIPFVVIRSISDNANTGVYMDYEKFKPLAIENSVVILKSMLQNM